MEMICFILLLLLGGVWETEAMPVTGELGQKITIKCSHVNAFSNVKYFCRGECTDEDVLISTKENKHNSNGKYSIKDEGNTFTVTISHLREDDSGTYWCGIDRVGLDTYNEVMLTVIVGNNDDDLPPSTNVAINTKSRKLVYIGAGLGVVVLALAMVLLIFFRHRKRDISTSSGKAHDTAYAAPSSLKQDVPHTSTAPSTATEAQEAHGQSNGVFNSSSVGHQDASRDNTHNVYSNVNASSEPQIQPDDLFYSTVSFSRHTDCSTVTPSTAVVTYSTIERV